MTGRGGFIALVEFGKPDAEEEKDISRTITALRKVFLLSLEGFFAASIIFVPCEPFSRFRTRRKKKEGRKKKEENYHRDVPTEGKKKRSLPSIRGTLKKTK